MPIFRRDPEKVTEAIYEKMVAKLAEKGDTLASQLQNEMASARTQTPVPNQATYTRAGDAYVFEEAVQLESTRPTGRDRRSVDQDRGRPGGFFTGGIFASRTPDATGRVPFERWPEQSWPGKSGGGGGCGCGSPGCPY